MRLPGVVRRALRLPPRLVVAKLAGKAWSVVERRRARAADLARCTYLDPAPASGLQRILDPFPAAALATDAELIRDLAGHAVAHRFDLLGSGWCTVRHGRACRGVEGYRYDSGPALTADPAGEWLRGRVTPANLAASQAAWRLIAPGYVPIDWQLDWKSGYRWSELAWYRDVAHGHRPGADIKVPWELARLQHLPVLALAWILEADAGDDAAAERCRRAYRDQVLDFVATNPPAFGVAWASPMEAGIRIANLVVAHDLFRGAGAEFEASFEAVLARTIWEHAEHLTAHLEWSPDFRGNHYLANVVGLLFAAASLPSTARSDAWLAFAVQELAVSAQEQFHPEGTNFEASTCYHRLSAEMICYGAALVQGLSEEKRAALQKYDPRLGPRRPALRPPPVPALDGAFFERLARMAQFTRSITKPDGLVPQIGDNDSGRFFKVVPPMRRLTVAEARARYVNLAGYDELPDSHAYWDEEVLDHADLLAGIGALLGDAAEAAHRPVEAAFVRALLRGEVRGAPGPLRAPWGPPPVAGSPEELTAVRRRIERLPGGDRYAVRVALPGGTAPALADLRTAAYPAFGLYLFRSRRIYLLVRCGPVGQHGLGGHAHSDQFAIELSVDGQNWLRDPGTYLYTAVPAIRERYRSARAHAGPCFEGWEPAELDLGPFRLAYAGEPRCLHFSEDGFAGCLTTPRGTLFALVTLGPEALEVAYGWEGRRRGGGPTTAAGNGLELLRPAAPWSPGYGKLAVEEARDRASTTYSPWRDGVKP